MRPAERLAALSAIKAGLEEAIAETKAEVLEEAATVGVRSFSTPYGPINVAGGDRKVIITDEAALLAHVKATRPDEVETVEAVRPAYITHLLSGLTIVAGHVIDAETAEVVEWAGLSAPGARYTTWPKSKEQAAAKGAASEAVRSGIGSVIANVAGLLP